ncbi:MAG: HEAT repeat domain-containing protein [Candidatus Moduliflexus flocculans]|nr:HEAT repeat domain-containing protein [Candidatus Moduliflexus flocculans]
MINAGTPPLPGGRHPGHRGHRPGALGRGAGAVPARRRARIGLGGHRAARAAPRLRRRQPGRAACAGAPAGAWASRHSPAQRRETAKLLGALGDGRYTLHLGAYLEDPDPSVRRLAAQACGRLKRPEFVERLLILLSDRDARQAASQALAAARRSGDRRAARLARRPLPAAGRAPAAPAGHPDDRHPGGQRDAAVLQHPGRRLPALPHRAGPVRHPPAAPRGAVRPQAGPGGGRSPGGVLPLLQRAVRAGGPSPAAEGAGAAGAPGPPGPEPRGRLPRAGADLPAPHHQRRSTPVSAARRATARPTRWSCWTTSSTARAASASCRSWSGTTPCWRSSRCGPRTSAWSAWPASW